MSLLTKEELDKIVSCSKHSGSDDYAVLRVLSHLDEKLEELHDELDEIRDHLGLESRGGAA